MEDAWLTPLTVIVLALAALGGLVLLRVLALFREQMVSLHDRAREANRVRTERTHRERDPRRADEETIVA